MKDHEDQKAEKRILLSQMRNSRETGIDADATAEKNGVFQYIGEWNTSLNKVQKEMAGNNLRRESIPSVLAQEDVFRLALKKINANQLAAAKAAFAPNGANAAATALNRTENAALILQWRGAVAASILAENCFWRWGDADAACGWKTLGIGLGPGKDTLPLDAGNRFVKAINDTLSAGRTWKALCITKQAPIRVFALLQASDDSVAVPAANLRKLIDPDTGKVWLTEIPWLTGYQEPGEKNVRNAVFGDPIRQLSILQLKILEREVIKAFNDQSKYSAAKAALQLFLNDIQSRLYELNQNEENGDEFEQLKMTICVALLLRDAIETPLTIRSVDPNELHRVGFENTTESRYFVFLNDRPIARLDGDVLLALQAPMATLQSTAYQALRTEVQRLLQDSNAKAVLHRKLTLLPEKYQHLIVIAELLAQTDAPTDAEYVLPGYVHETLDPEEFLKDSDFYFFRSAFTRESLCQAEIFSDYAMVFMNQGLTVDDTGAPGMSFYRGLVPSRWYELETDGVAKPAFISARILLPMGKSGGILLYDAREYSEDAERVNIRTWETEDDRSEPGIAVEYREKADGVWYTFQKKFDHKHLQVMDSIINVPAIGVWPDNRNIPLSLEWKTFFTYIGYPHNEDNYNARLFHREYQTHRILETKPRNIRISRVGGNGFTFFNSIHTANFPMFALLTYNRHTVGVVPCREETQWTRNDLTAVLAVDFGTSSTVGAYLVAPQRLQASPDNPPKPPTFQPTSCVTWQINQSFGELESLTSFLPEKMNVSLPTNQNGALFTQVRRFNSSLEFNNDPDQMEPFRDGNIAYIGDNEPKYDPHIFSGLKFSGIDAKDRNANIALFLKQILFMYFLRCYQAGAKQIQVRFAVPLAMKEEQQTDFRNLVQTLCEDVSKQTGLPLCKEKGVLFSTESRAVATYYLRSQPVGMDDADINITLDIGGGTSDFSIFGKKDIAQGTNMQGGQYYSTRLAGRFMISERLYDPRPAKLRDEALQMELPVKANAQTAASNANPTAAQKDPKVPAHTAIADSSTLDSFVLTFDQRMRRETNHDPQLKGILFQDMVNNTDKDLHYLLAFQLTLLIWFAGLLSQQKKMQDEINKPVKPTSVPVNTAGKKAAATPVKSGKLTICLAGYGANFFRMFDQDTQKKIMDVALKTDKKTTGNIVYSEHQKEEVSKGLLYFSEKEMDMSKPAPKAAQQYPAKTNNARALTPDEMWNRLDTMLREYSEKFTQDSVIAALKKDTEKMSQLKSAFLSRITDMSALCENLTWLCESIGIGK